MTHFRSRVPRNQQVEIEPRDSTMDDLLWNMKCLEELKPTRAQLSRIEMHKKNRQRCGVLVRGAAFEHAFSTLSCDHQQRPESFNISGWETRVTESFLTALKHYVDDLHRMPSVEEYRAMAIYAIENPTK